MSLTIESLQKARSSLAESPQPEFIEVKIGVAKFPDRDERAKIAEWWNANNTNEIVTGAYFGLSWDELPEWAQESAIKLYRSCQAH